MDNLRPSQVTNRHIFAIILLAIMVSVFFQGTRGLYETSEGRYAECAREMIESGNYLEPKLGYHPHWSKPPLTYWAIAGGIKLLGYSEWGVRLFNIIAFLSTCIAVYFLGETLFEKSSGAVSALVYASSPFPVFGAYAVTTDTLLSMWEAYAVLSYIKAYKSKTSEVSSMWIIGMWIFLGLGFLTKGPPALLILAPIIIWNLWKGKGVKIINIKGLVLFIAIGFSWFIYVCIKDYHLFRYFLGVEIKERIFSSSMHHSEWYAPFTIYLPALTLGSGIWIYFILRKEFKELKKLLRPKSIFVTDNGFLFLWIVIPLTVFSVVKSRLWLYVLPIYVPVSIVLGRAILNIINNKRASLKGIIKYAYIMGICLIIIKGVSAFYPNKNNMKQLYQWIKRIEPENYEVMVFNQPKLFGLQYYLNGKLKRIAEGKRDWSDYDINGLIDVIKRKKSQILLISDSRDKKTLTDILKENNVSFSLFSSKYWHLFKINTRI